MHLDMSLFNRIRNMKKIIAFLAMCSLISPAILMGQEKMKTDTLNFLFEGKKLSGFIDMPVNQESTSIIIIVPGHEKTNFGESFWYYDSLISNFKNLGISCFRWDKAGCGKSEGEYNHYQTVQSSAKEIISAIEELKRRKIMGSDKIGLWGISRAGYICPLVIQEYPSIAFWISVSGTDGLDSSPYQIESDFRFAGKSKAEAKLLITEYLNGGVIFENGGTYEEYLKAQQHLRKDSYCIDYLGWSGGITKESYNKEQESNRGKISYYRDEKTKAVIMVPDFKKVLNKIQCPVLAINGEKDYVVDWRRTLVLYKGTIGKNNSNKLTIKTFPDGNHSLIKCKTGASNETIDKREFCDGYIETMTTWLKEKVLENK